MRDPAGAAPSIAVIVPNYNDSRFLRRCLESVLGQAVPPDEFIVVDDCSTDGSVALIRSLIAGRAHARLIENPANLGVYGAVDRGLAHSSSEYALFLSSNDCLLPGLIARAKACLARAPGAGLWSALAWQVDEEDRLLRLQSTAIVATEDSYFSPEACRGLAWRHGNWFTGTSLVYQRKALDAVGRFDPAYKGLADLLAALAVASRFGAAYTPEPLAMIRVHGGSILSGTLADTAALEAMLERLERRGPEIAPALFTPAFLARTAQRFRFAALRAAGGGWRRLPRVALAFLALRPFDVVPALWNRMLGSLWVRLRSQPPLGG
jgi:hypothetical protein